MSTIPDEIAAVPSGARFLRADLHIHSFDASHDVKDMTMTPAAIVDTAVSEGLGLIAITDHNEISNVETALRAAEGKPVFVVPALNYPRQKGICWCIFATFFPLETSTANWILRTGEPKRPGARRLSRNV